jgi:hypothetical protein
VGTARFIGRSTDADKGSTNNGAGSGPRSPACRFTPEGFSVTFANMSERPDDELKLLARAFDRVWKRYCRPGRIGAIPKAWLDPLSQNI